MTYILCALPSWLRVYTSCTTNFLDTFAPINTAESPTQYLNFLDHNLIPHVPWQSQITIQSSLTVSKWSTSESFWMYTPWIQFKYNPLVRLSSQSIRSVLQPKSWAIRRKSAKKLFSILDSARASHPELILVWINDFSPCGYQRWLLHCRWLLLEKDQSLRDKDLWWNTISWLNK